MDWNEDLAALVMEAWNEGVSGNEQLFDENSLEDTVRGYFVEPLRNRFANDGFVVDSPYGHMNSEDVERVRKKILVGKIARMAIPDLIIHRRNEDDLEHNLLALEIKKVSNPDWANDVEKLEEMTAAPRLPRRFQYQFGLLLRYTTSGQIAVAALFENGQPFELNTTTLMKN